MELQVSFTFGIERPERDCSVSFSDAACSCVIHIVPVQSFCLRVRVILKFSFDVFDVWIMFLQDAMERLEEDLTCPVCCDLFDDPRVLLCSHTFCRKCLQDVIEANRAPHFRTPLRCPTCRKETPQNGADSLQINYSMRRIVEKYSKIRSLPRLPSCKQHSGQPLNMFCATDLKLICGICATSDDHKSHEFCSLEDAFEKEKAEFGELHRVVETWDSAKIHSCVETLQSGKNAALQRASGDAEKVTQYFDSLVGALESKKSEVLSDLETRKQAVMEEFDPEITQLSAALEEQTRALCAAECLRSVTDPQCFLLQMQEFRERVRVLRETPMPTRKDAGAFVRNFDVQKWDSVRLRDVDKISVPHRAECSRAARTLMALLGVLLCCALIWIHQAVIPESYLHSEKKFFSEVYTHLTHTFLYCQEMYKTFVGAGHEYINSSVLSAVDFIGSFRVF
ncbi:tripartite motif-containing 13 [Thalassophryne amazonica]|uniref:tripartite motif-containing 13 n=1 Tax=Thalassophryne amazonica TaxID=390379 RepID=UPI0014712BDE|nr:tripartite motif-containing 13 [Thalassophryne amazonica]